MQTCNKTTDCINKIDNLLLNAQHIEKKETRFGQVFVIDMIKGVNVETDNMKEEKMCGTNSLVPVSTIQNGNDGEMNNGVSEVKINKEPVILIDKIERCLVVEWYENDIRREQRISYKKYGNDKAKLRAKELIEKLKSGITFEQLYPDKGPPIVKVYENVGDYKVSLIRDRIEREWRVEWIDNGAPMKARWSCKKVGNDEAQKRADAFAQSMIKGVFNPMLLHKATGTRFSRSDRTVVKINVYMKKNVKRKKKTKSGIVKAEKNTPVSNGTREGLRRSRNNNNIANNANNEYTGCVLKNVNENKNSKSNSNYNLNNGSNDENSVNIQEYNGSTTYYINTGETVKNEDENSQKKRAYTPRSKGVRSTRLRKMSKTDGKTSINVGSGNKKGRPTTQYNETNMNRYTINNHQLVNNLYDESLEKNPIVWSNKNSKMNSNIKDIYYNNMTNMCDTYHINNNIHNGALDTNLERGEYPVHIPYLDNYNNYAFLNYNIENSIQNNLQNNQYNVKHDIRELYRYTNSNNFLNRGLEMNNNLYTIGNINKDINFIPDSNLENKNYYHINNSDVCLANYNDNIINKNKKYGDSNFVILPTENYNCEIVQNEGKDNTVLNSGVYRKQTPNKTEIIDENGISSMNVLSVSKNELACVERNNVINSVNKSDEIKDNTNDTPIFQNESENNSSCSKVDLRTSKGISKNENNINEAPYYCTSHNEKLNKFEYIVNNNYDLYESNNIKKNNRRRSTISNGYNMNNEKNDESLENNFFDNINKSKTSIQKKRTRYSSLSRLNTNDHTICSNETINNNYDISYNNQINETKDTNNLYKYVGQENYMNTYIINSNDSNLRIDDKDENKNVNEVIEEGKIYHSYTKMNNMVSIDEKTRIKNSKDVSNIYINDNNLICYENMELKKLIPENTSIEFVENPRGYRVPYIYQYKMFYEYFEVPLNASKELGIQQIYNALLFCLHILSVGWNVNKNEYIENYLNALSNPSFKNIVMNNYMSDSVINNMYNVGYNFPNSNYNKIGYIDGMNSNLFPYTSMNNTNMYNNKYLINNLENVNLESGLTSSSVMPISTSASNMDGVYIMMDNVNDSGILSNSSRINIKDDNCMNNSTDVHNFNETKKFEEMNNAKNVISLNNMRDSKQMQDMIYLNDINNLYKNPMFYNMNSGECGMNNLANPNLSTDINSQLYMNHIVNNNLENMNSQKIIMYPNELNNISNKNYINSMKNIVNLNNMYHTNNFNDINSTPNSAYKLRNPQDISNMDNINNSYNMNYMKDNINNPTMMNRMNMVNTIDQGLQNINYGVDLNKNFSYLNSDDKKNIIMNNDYVINDEQICSNESMPNISNGYYKTINNNNLMYHNNYQLDELRDNCFADPSLSASKRKEGNVDAAGDSINDKNDSKTDAKENFDKENVEVTNYNDSIIDMNRKDYYTDLNINGNNKIDVGSKVSRTHESKDNVNKDDLNLVEENINNGTVSKNSDGINTSMQENNASVSKQSGDNANGNKESSFVMNYNLKPCMNENETEEAENKYDTDNSNESSTKNSLQNSLSTECRSNIINYNNDNDQNIMNNNMASKELVKNNNMNVINQNIDKCDEMIYNGYIKDSKNNTSTGSIYLSPINLIKDSYNYEFYSNTKMIEKIRSTSNSSTINTEYLSSNHMNSSSMNNGCPSNNINRQMHNILEK
ncbi:transcription factor with AP2 domain(s), putative SPE2-interacting protein, putative [Plasmodium vinckei lentum]|uniref:Transcription factor with AP2 domain(S), putative SPE2-interacting protein, putative n=1 Tax=Plasmodium vinckei lentum TaxID=138297 RepID=A0A6V7RSJ7_PLAVN|nr:transcription factor with AP2 domain(s), putative SPE2-interacting protein, putative [Plasmodium vinckei lentum]